MRALVRVRASVNELRRDWRGLVETHTADLAFEAHMNGEPAREPDVWDWFEIRLDAAAMLVRYKVGAAICARFGHSSATDVEDGIIGDYEEHPDDGLERSTRRLLDIDGGRVSWYCPRCGQGGTNYF